MPSRRLSPDQQREIRLAAMLSRASYNDDRRTPAEDVAAIVEAAGVRTDLLAQAVGLHTLGWADDDTWPRKRELAALLVDLDLPDADHWYDIARDRAGRGAHTSTSFSKAEPPRPSAGRPWS